MRHPDELSPGFGRAPTEPPQRHVVGREREFQRLEQFRNSLLEGHSGVLVVHGEPGIGKTTVLERFTSRQRACRVESCAGVESEMELAWAGLHQLCIPLLDRLDRIPAPQRVALSAAFGLAEAPAPDPFLVGLAVLSLLTEAADARPIISIVDDAHAFDQASLRAIAFAGRRLQTEAVGLIFAVREIPAELARFPDLSVDRLTAAEAGTLLDTVAPSRLDPKVRERIVAETSGNPLAIVELAEGGHLRRLAGGYGAPAVRPVRSRIEESILEAFGQLPSDCRRLMTVAAADPTGDAVVLGYAAHAMGVEMPDRNDQRLLRLITFSPRVRFNHPLVRSAIYGACGDADRRAAHRVLAQVTDPEQDPDRRAWHLAYAQEGQDESIARELERSAERALARAGFAGAAAFQSRAARLTPDPALRARRELAAASAYFQSGDPESALELLESAETHSLDEQLLAHVELLRGQIAFHLSRGARAPTVLLEAARRLERFDPALAREAYLAASSASIFAGQFSVEPPRSVADVVLGRAPTIDPPRPVDLLLDAVAVRQARGVAAATPVASASTRALLNDSPPSTETTRYMWTAARMALETLDCEGAFALAERQVQILRETGALLPLAIALVPLVTTHLLRGDLATAEALAYETVAVSADAGVPAPRWPLLMVEALRGDPDRFSPVADSIVRDARDSGEGHVLLYADFAVAIFNNGQSDYRAALDRAMKHVGGPPEPLYAPIMAFEFIEAAARAGNADETVAAQQFVEHLTSASTSGWARGLRALTCALLSPTDDAGRFYTESQAHLQSAGMAMYAARVHLLFGEWLRREGRRKESRAALREALTMTSHIGMEAFARRATRELELAGDTSVRSRPKTGSDELTPQELQVAQMAAAGLSNRRIGERLFLSHRTVASHLYRVYPKLGITSRNQLHRVLVEPPNGGSGTWSR